MVVSYKTNNAYAKQAASKIKHVIDKRGLFATKTDSCDINRTSETGIRTTCSLIERTISDLVLLKFNSLLLASTKSLNFVRTTLKVAPFIAKSANKIVKRFSFKKSFKKSVLNHWLHRYKIYPIPNDFNAVGITFFTDQANASILRPLS